MNLTGRTTDFDSALLGIDRSLQLGACSKFRTLAGSDFNCCAGLWITAGTCGRFRDAESTEADQLNGVALAKRVRDDLEQRVDALCTRRFGIACFQCQCFD